MCCSHTREYNSQLFQIPVVSLQFGLSISLPHCTKLNLSLAIPNLSDPGKLRATDRYLAILTLLRELKAEAMNTEGLQQPGERAMLASRFASPL